MQGVLLMNTCTLMFLLQDLVVYSIIHMTQRSYGTFNRDLLKIFQQVHLIETVPLIETLYIFDCTVRTLQSKYPLK